jgi:hypothetical protein
MQQYPPAATVANADSLARPSSAIDAATMGLYGTDGVFYGSVLGIGSRLAVTAGHHFRTTVDFIDFYKLRVRHGVDRWVRINYWTKDPANDVMFMWTEDEVPCVPLRSCMPPVGCLVNTRYISPAAPYELALSPATVVASSATTCQASGSVTTFGASGAPVVCSYGDRVVGIHLAVSDESPDGVNVSEFVTSRCIVQYLVTNGFDPSDAAASNFEEAPAVPSAKEKERLLARAAKHKAKEKAAKGKAADKARAAKLREKAKAQQAKQRAKAAVAKASAKAASAEKAAKAKAKMLKLKKKKK